MDLVLEGYVQASSFLPWFPQGLALIQISPGGEETFTLALEASKQVNLITCCQRLRHLFVRQPFASRPAPADCVCPRVKPGTHRGTSAALASRLAKATLRRRGFARHNNLAAAGVQRCNPSK